MNFIMVNNKKYNIDKIQEDTPILWVLRDNLNLTGTKFGCGVGMCGCCTIVLDGKAVRGCQTKLSEVVGKSIITIENEEDKELNSLRIQWKVHDVAQCGYCQPGQLMNATGLLKSNSKPNIDEIKTAMQGNICRCGTYNKILTAINTVAKG